MKPPLRLLAAWTTVGLVTACGAGFKASAGEAEAALFAEAYYLE